MFEQLNGLRIDPGGSWASHLDRLLEVVSSGGCRHTCAHQQHDLLQALLEMPGAPRTLAHNKNGAS